MKLSQKCSFPEESFPEGRFPELIFSFWENILLGNSHQLQKYIQGAGKNRQFFCEENSLFFKKEDDYGKITLMEDHRGVVSNKTRRDGHEIKVQEMVALCKSYHEVNDKKVPY